MWIEHASLRFPSLFSFDFYYLKTILIISVYFWILLCCFVLCNRAESLLWILPNGKMSTLFLNYLPRIMIKELREEGINK